MSRRNHESKATDIKKDAPAPPPQEAEATTSFSVVLVHVFWLFMGPFILGVLLLNIGESGGGWTSSLDLGVLIVAVMMFCARWIDQRSGQGTTVAGEMSTWTDFRRYAVRMPAIVAAGWVAANVIGNYL